MAIKGIKEALARKRAQQQPDNKDSDQDIKVVGTAPVKVGGNKPQKKVTGRGR